MSSKNKQSFMNRFIAFMEKYFEPVAARIEKQRHISSIKKWDDCFDLGFNYWIIFADYFSNRKYVSSRFCCERILCSKCSSA